jgi:cellulose biosynthesis protein BcsQ
MSSVIAIANIAGGTYKSTTAHSLAVASVEYGKKVLLIDLDPRAELTFNLGYEKSRETILEILQGLSLSQNNDMTTVERFDFLGADSRLASFNDVNALKSFLGSLSARYDLVIIDTAAQIDSRLAMALMAADAIVTPTSASIHSIRGAISTLKVDSKAKKFILPIDGFGADQVKLFSNEIVIDAHIPCSLGIDAATSQKRSVLSVDKSSDFAEACREAAYTLLEHLNLF